MGRIFSVFLLLAIFAGGFFLLKQKDLSVVSPIPKVFGISKSPIVNKWFPKKDLFSRTDSINLSLAAKSALLVDFDNGKIIYAKNENEKLPIASTAKIMTALIALDNANLADSFLVSEKAAKIGENSMGLTIGEKLTLEELLYGLMLVSGNDAAVTIAEGIGGTEEKFVDLMNEKVRALGLKNTWFVNASGLDEDAKEQYSSAYDLSVIAHYVWENYPKFRQITSTFNKYIEANSNHKAFDLYNDTNLLTTYPGVKGIKPGFTWEAGLCLVSYAENGGKKLLAVILGSDDRRGEMKELLDLGFNSFGIKISHPALDM